MALREELEASGGKLFRMRSYLPLLMLALVVAALTPLELEAKASDIGRPWELLCLAVALAGLGIRVYTVGHVPAGTSGRSTRGLRAEHLNTTGMYSIVRHPLYLGNYFLWLGPALFARSASVAVIVSLLFWVYHERIMLAEEAFLRRQYGDEFERWATHTPAFVPSIRGWRAPGLPFSARTAIRREDSGLFGMIGVFWLLKFVSDVVRTGGARFDPFWTTLFILGAIAYVTVRVLARQTQTLATDGR
jgi:protein-S-isoprenylcysteine O-methyltransferase Ste14